MVHVPVHRERGGPEELGPVHADVVTRRLRLVAVVRMDRVHAGERDVPPAPAGGAGLLRGHSAVHGGGIAIERPALQDGEPSEVDFIPVGSLHHLLAPAGADRLRWDSEEWGELPDLGDDLPERSRGLWLGERADPRRDRLETAMTAGAFEGRLHPVIGTVEIDGEGKVAALDVLEEQCGATEPTAARIEGLGIRTGTRTGGQRESVRDLRDFQDRAHGCGDAVKLAGGVKGRDEGLQVRHGRSA